MARKYSKKYPPEKGDRVGMYTGGTLVEAFVVAAVLDDGATLRVENLTVSEALGTSYPNGAVSFLGPDEDGLRLISRAASDPIISSAAPFRGWRKGTSENNKRKGTA